MARQTKPIRTVTLVEPRSKTPNGVDADILKQVVAVRAQIKGGVFPIRLKAEDWQSGEINWLLDVIAPTKETTASVIANFKQVVKGGDLRLHPIVAKLVDAETLEKMGAQKGVPSKGDQG